MKIVFDGEEKELSHGLEALTEMFQLIAKTACASESGSDAVRMFRIGTLLAVTGQMLDKIADAVRVAEGKKP